MVEPRTHLARLPARALPPHRHASRLRARRVRRVHRPGRRRAGALLHHFCGRMRWADGADDRRLRGRCADAAAARSVSREHALQCGFCTPGMLIAARDIVKRLPRAGREPDSRGARGQPLPLHRLSRHRRRSAQRGRDAGGRLLPRLNRNAGPPQGRSRPSPRAIARPRRPDRGQSQPHPKRAPPLAKGANRFEESFVIRRPPAEVWRLFADLPAVAACLPGAALTEHDEHSAKGSMRVKLGPIAAAFAGSASIERDNVAMCGVIRGAGQDRPVARVLAASVTYPARAENDGKTRVSIVVEYTLQGMLAQFSRTTLVQDLGRRLGRRFCREPQPPFQRRRRRDGRCRRPAECGPTDLGEGPSAAAQADSGLDGQAVKPTDRGRGFGAALALRRRKAPPIRRGA